MRMLQVIDIGTNSVRSIVVEVPVGGPYRVIDDEKEMTRLGEGLANTGELSPDAIDRSVAAVTAMAGIGKRMGVAEVRAVATEAVRRASNGSVFVDRVRAEAGIELEVVSAEDEGRFVWQSARTLAKGDTPAAAIDIGGGSVEIVQGRGEELQAIASMPVGARVLADRFVTTDPVAEDEFKRLRAEVRRTLRESVTPIAPGSGPLIGSGGTVNNIAAVLAAARGKTYASLHGVEIDRADLMQLVGRLSHSTVAQRQKIPGMAPDRVDIIMPGAVVLAEAVKLFGASGVIVNTRGTREGVVIDTLDRDGAVDPSADLMAGVRDLAVRYRYDRAHAEHVAALATSLFDQLAGPLELDPSGRQLLEAAAVLHDIGYFIAYDRHHEHTYHLIVHSMVPGLTQREQSMVAAIARYHRKSVPKAKHVAWATLEPADQPQVAALAAILRLADGLDRGRSAHIDAVTATATRDAVHLEITGEGDLDAEIYGLGKKKDLFEMTFRRTVAFSVAGETDPTGGVRP